MIAKAAEILYHQGVKIVVVTLGGNGAYLYSRRKNWQHLPVLETPLQAFVWRKKVLFWPCQIWRRWKKDWGIRNGIKRAVKWNPACWYSNQRY